MMQPLAPFEVPAWLHPWWDLMVPLTAALYWPAWAAAFTFLALLNTARIADRGRREERERRALAVEHAAIMIDGANVPLRRLLAHLKAGHNVERASKAAVEAYTAARAGPDYLDQIDAKNFPNISTLDNLTTAKLAFPAAYALAQKLHVEGEQAFSPSFQVEFERNVNVINNVVVHLMTAARKLNGRSFRNLDFSHHQPGTFD